MSFASSLFQMSFPVLSIGAILQGACMLALLAGVLVFFRPLLSGMVRALVLTLRPRPGRVQAARPAPGA